MTRRLKRTERVQAARERQAIVSRRGWSLSELLEAEFPPTSEDKLEALGRFAWTPKEFREAVRAFTDSADLNVIVARKPSEVVGEYAGMYYSYNQLSDCIERMKAGEELVVVLVMEDTNVIGYGYAVPSAESAHIEIIEVDGYSTRSCGLGDKIVLQGQEFSVGVGHALVYALINALPSNITADATKKSSRYIFKSLGFVRQPEKANPCLLWLPR